MSLSLSHTPIQIIFYGLKRSGNHAIIHWIIHNLSKNKIIKETLQSSVFETDDGPNGTLVFFNDITNTTLTIKPIINKYLKYKIKIASVEEHYVDPFNTLMARILDTNIPIIKIFIFRSPMNCFASRIKSFQLTDIQQFKNKFINLFNKYILYKYNSIYIKYDDWLDKTVRTQFCTKYNIQNNEKYIHITTKEGGGSFFNNKNYTQRYKLVPLSQTQINILKLLNNIIS
jgi:hypothetical protein